MIVKATVVALKDKEIKAYIPKYGFTGTIITTVLNRNFEIECTFVEILVKYK